MQFSTTPVFTVLNPNLVVGVKINPKNLVPVLR
jgi:hypothetical protein